MGDGPINGERFLPYVEKVVLPTVTIKAILAALPIKPAVNAVAVWDYLTLTYLAPSETIWQIIEKLHPGHVERYSLKQLQADIIQF